MNKPRDWPVDGTTHPDGLLTAFEVSLRLRISVSQVYALHASGRLPGYRLTTKQQGGLRFAEKHLASLLEASERGVALSPPDAPGSGADRTSMDSGRGQEEEQS